jgi:hypothetical protein
MPSPVTVKRSGPGLAQLKADLARISKSEVLVGIPADKTQRRGDAITNASILFIFSKGSPLKKIPARPWLEPAIKLNKDLITPHLGAAAKAVLDHNPMRAERELKLAGTVAANAARRFPTDPRNAWAPNAPSTIRRKKKSDVPGINTGQVRRALTWVLRQKT